MTLKSVISQATGSADNGLLNLVKGIPHTKAIFTQENLVATLNLRALQSYGVNNVFYFSQNIKKCSHKTVIFVARGDNIADVERVATQLSRLAASRPDDGEPQNMHIFWAPRKTHIANDILETRGLLGETQVHEYPLYFVPLASDLLSLEMNSSFVDLYRYRNSTCVYTMAVALMQLQTKVGLFPRITGKGQYAKQVRDLLLKMREEQNATDSNTTPSASSYDLTPSSIVDSVIIIDRQVDFATPLMTQMTYEGLIDEEYGIQSQHVELDSSMVVGNNYPSLVPISSPLKKNVQLSDEIELYRSLRDATLRPAILTIQAANTKATQAPLSSETVVIRSNVAMHISIAESLHTFLSSQVFERIQYFEHIIMHRPGRSTDQHDILRDLIARRIPLPKILRMLCLESCVYGGYISSVYNELRRSILQAYGTQHLLTLSNLEKMGLLTTRAGGSIFYSAPTPAPTPTWAPTYTPTDYLSVRKPLSLYAEDIDHDDPTDISYVLYGVAPLSIRLVQCILQKEYILGLGKRSRSTKPMVGSVQSSLHGWLQFENPVENIVKQMEGGPVFDDVQVGDENATRVKQLLSASSNSGSAVRRDTNSQTNDSKDRTAGESGSNLTSSAEKVILVVFVGGVSRVELSALRFIFQQFEREGKQRKLLVCTTNVISSNKLLDEVTEKGRS